MSENTKLDPATLTAEEKAIVEEMVTRDQMFWPPTQSSNALVMDKPDLWKQSYDCAFNRILARRALFGSATEKAVCPNCGDLVRRERDHYSEGSEMDMPGFYCLRQQPAPPEPAAQVNTGRAVRQFERMIHGVGNSEPAAPEMPEAVKGAIDFLRELGSEGNPGKRWTESICRQCADAIESWWRTNAQSVSDMADAAENYRESYEQGNKDGAQPVAAGSVVLEFLERLQLDKYAQGWETFHADLAAAIAAVRQQAAKGKPKVELPKVPVDALKRACATCSLDDCMTIAGWLDAVEGRK